jgi:hypothetical protein
MVVPGWGYYRIADGANLLVIQTLLGHESLRARCDICNSPPSGWLIEGCCEPGHPGFGLPLSSLFVFPLVSFQFDPRDFVFDSCIFREFLPGSVCSRTRSFAEPAQLSACLRIALLGSLRFRRQQLTGEAFHGETIPHERSMARLS